jgi:NitT/TauT family transport system substrate-binding protein
VAIWRRTSGLCVRPWRLLCCLCALVACAGPDRAPAPNGDLDDITVLTILPLEDLTFTPELVAESRGYFRQRGLAVHFEATQGSPPAIGAVLAGSALLTRVGDIETMVAAGKRGAPLVVVGSAAKTGTIRIVSRRAAPITTTADFRGKLVGTPSTGGTSELTLDLVLASAGIPLDTVRRQVVGLAPGVFDLVKAGRIDAYIVPLDVSLQLAATEPEAVVFDPADVIDAGAQVYVTSADQARDPVQQDRLRRYLLAVRDAMAFVVADADTGFARTLPLLGATREVPALRNPEVARRALQVYAVAYARDTGPSLVAPSLTRWAATYQEVAGVGLVPPGLDPASWVTDAFVPVP